MSVDEIIIPIYGFWIEVEYLILNATPLLCRPSQSLRVHVIKSAYIYNGIIYIYIYTNEYIKVDYIFIDIYLHSLEEDIRAK